VGIFHESPESAAKQVAKVWDDVDAWWDNQDVVSVRKEFCMRYADLADDLLKRIEKALRDAFCSHHQ
jgi:putative transferase (TIGR04331 family)